MKKKTGKRIRCGSPAGAIFVLGVLILVVGGSFAAYTNFQSVKRVVSTGTQSDTMFGSNYLSLIRLTDENPPVKRISLVESDNYYTIMVIVCNYVWGDETLYNPKNITYTVSAVLTATDGGENLPDGIKEITMSGNSFDTNGTCTLKDQKLAAGKAEKNSYSFRIPKALKDKIKIQITAEPDSSSADAVNSQKLAAILSFADYKVTKNWTGKFLDSTINKSPLDYDAFNYEISGNGEGKVAVTWDDKLQLSSWTVIGGKNTTVPEQGKHSYVFDVDASTTAIQFQFYRNPDKPLEEKDNTWISFGSLVTVSYQEKKAEGAE